MDIELSDELASILDYSREEAIRTGCKEILPAHLVLGILRHRWNAACQILEKSGIDREQLKSALEACVDGYEVLNFNDMDSVELSFGSEIRIGTAISEAADDDSEEVSASHLLLSILRDREDRACKVLEQNFGCRYQIVKANLTASAKKKTAEEQNFELILQTFTGRSVRYLS